MRSTIFCFALSFVLAAGAFAQENDTVTEPAKAVTVLNQQDQVTQPNDGAAVKQDDRSDDEKPELGAILQANSAGGVIVQSVYTNGPLHQQDFHSGDLIRTIDAAAIANPNDVIKFLKQKKPGDLITVSRERAGQTDELSVKLMSKTRLFEVSNTDGEPNANISRQYVASNQVSAETIVRLQKRLADLEAEVARLRAALESKSQDDSSNKK